MNRDGQIRTSIAPYEFKTAAQIREGDFKVPAPKKLAATAAPAPSTFIDDDGGELPF